MVTVVTLSRQEMNMDTHCYTNLKSQPHTMSTDCP